MTKKKSGFLTFCFSLIPGAGEMYMGFMKQGLSIMAAFWLMIFLAAFLNLGPVLFVLPILWCYSFFNVHNIRGMSDEEFYALEDDYAFHVGKLLPLDKMGHRQNTILATVLIILGIMVLWNNMVDYLEWLIPRPLYWAVTQGIPQVLVGLGLIGAGLYLIRGKKRELDEEDDRQEEMLK